MLAITKFIKCVYILQDAFDFFTALTDQLDETLKRYKREPVFQNRLQGVFSDQKNCEDCPHKYVFVCKLKILARYWLSQ